MGDEAVYQDPWAAGLESGASDWRLLLPLISDDHVDWTWEDCGMLYFWITDDALQSARFDRVWMVLQTT